MTICIRKASEDDADVLFALAAGFATSFLVESAAFEKGLADIVYSEGANLTVAEVNGEIVGYCLGFDHYTFYANGRVAWVEEITVEQSMRGQGIGKTLMGNFEDWSRNRGCKLVALATRRAAFFYRSIGYEESATYFRKLL